MRPLLVVMAKAPRLGLAKTRLARAIGPVHALRAYRTMLAHVARAARDPRWTTVIALTPDRAAARPMAPFVDFPMHPQGGGDLGDRQARVFAHNGPVVVVGADAPQITPGDIWAAFRALRRADAVIGPATDGGYWLLGLNGPGPEDLFEGVRWSHAETRADLERKLAPGRIAHLRRLTDIDDVEDWRAWTRRSKRLEPRLQP
ncbi:MAG: TIGR04282 family arsenosugar biosynthesis glycosyltransferase [Maricaulaceae bacterium]